MNKNQQQSRILVYTRNPKEDYTQSLSNSIHFAYCDAEEAYFKPLNRNYGILFAKATIDEQNIIQEKGLINPYLFRCPNSSFGIIAVRVTKAGEDDLESKGHILLWTSEDLINFHYIGLLNLHKDLFVKNAKCEYCFEKRKYIISWQDRDGNCYRNILDSLSNPDGISVPEQTDYCSFEELKVSLKDIDPGNILLVEKSIGEAFRSNWTPVYNTEIRVPNSIKITSREQLEEVKATIVYSDGSTADKRVIWDSELIDFSIPGSYTVKGRVDQESYSFLLATGYADPVILPFDGKYYFVATNDNKDDIGIYVREANSISDLFAPGFKESLILDVQEEKGFVQTFWAPEFHWIGEDLYILFAVSGTVWGPQCHAMKLKKRGNILNPTDWEEPIRVRRMDGAYLAEDGITLDMTYFKTDGVSCMVWSYRKGIGTPYDTGSMLYIATVDETNPTILTSEPVLLSRPLYGWENIQGTINNEGPYPLITEDTVYITYSGGAACGYTYALGLLSIPRGGNFLDAAAWKKSSTPVLSYYSLEGVYGPGHNSFFRDYNGNTMIMYHGEKELVPFGTRCSTMHRVHFNKQGIPIFDIAGGRDVNIALTEVVTKIIVS
jgi:GH43 family beta-xylosidase